MATMEDHQKISILQLEDLPDEILIKVISYLVMDIKDLIKLSQTSKRIRRICHDESLWQKMNLYYKRVPTDFIKTVLENGCRYLSLNTAVLLGDTMNLSKVSKLCYLDLSFCFANDRVFEEILKSCHSLQKLSFQTLYSAPLNSNILHRSVHI